MAALNEAAKTTLREARIPFATWARANYMADGRWCGDACGCPDDRCIGYHHFEDEECGCLPVLIEQYVAREGMFQR